MLTYLFGGGMWAHPWGPPFVCMSLCVNRVAYGNHVSGQLFHLPKGKSTVSLIEVELPELLSWGGKSMLPLGRFEH